jgi:hypothetical protein
MKSNLTKEQMAVSLFVLCSDVSLLNTRAGSFYYFRPSVKENIMALQYILRRNGIRGQKYNSHFYSPYGAKTLVFRVSQYDIDTCENQEFKTAFQSAYKLRTEYLRTGVAFAERIDKLFWMKSKSGKEKCLFDMLQRVR